MLLDSGSPESTNAQSARPAVTGRPGFVKGSVTAQLLIAIAYLAFGAAFVRTNVVGPRNVGEAFAFAAIPGVAASWALVAVGLVSLAGAYGMWTGALWGWWVSFAIDLCTSCGSAYQLLKDLHYLDTGQITFAVLLVIIPLALILLPGVRRHYHKG